jgi:hypothetical protein
VAADFGMIFSSELSIESERTSKKESKRKKLKTKKKIVSVVEK